MSRTGEKRRSSPGRPSGAAKLIGGRTHLCYIFNKISSQRRLDVMRLRALAVLLLVTALAAPSALAWRKYAGQSNPSTGWPGVRVTDENGEVVAVISFLTPDASFSVPYVTLEETMDANDIATWNEFDEDADPVMAKRVNGCAQALKVCKLKVYDYLPEEAWEACGGHSAFVNHNVRIVVGYLKGTKYKKIEVEDYRADPAMMGVEFELEPIKEITEMGPICWGYWLP